MKKMKYIALAIIILCACIAMASLVQIKKQEFSALFWERQKQGPGDISAIAEIYVMRCCKNPQEAIKMLERNGFSVQSFISVEDVDRINDQYKKTSKIKFTQFIQGTRGSIIPRFWDMLASYQVSLFIKDNEIIQVRAKVDRTLP